MATGVTDEYFEVQDQTIDALEEKFHKKLSDFSVDVKSTVRSVPRDVGAECFQLALLFLTQAFPNLRDVVSVARKNQPETARHGESLKELDDSHNKLKQSQKKMERSLKKLEEAQRKHLGDLEKRTDAIEKEMKKLKKSSKTNEYQIWGLRKLQKLLKFKTESPQAAATTAPTASASASAIPRGPLKSLSERTSFSAKVTNDTTTSIIGDLKLLSDGLVLVADFHNHCVKLFSTLGQFFHSQRVDGWPLSMAVIDSTTPQSWDVAVTVWYSCKIVLLKVFQHGISVTRDILASKKYEAIAAVDRNTLAVGYYGSPGIDLIDLSGRVLRNISSVDHPHCMVVSPDQHLIMATPDHFITKIKLLDGSRVYKHKVAQAQGLRGIACHSDGSTIIADDTTRTLHLVTCDGRWVKQLWAHPSGPHATFGDWLMSVSVIESMCLCSTADGSVFVLDVCY